MAYFVTGATGFIGQFLVRNLLQRGEPIYVLVRKGSVKKLDALREAWGADRQAGDRGRRRPRQEEPRRVADADLTQAQGQGRTTSSTSPRSTTSRRRAEAQQVANVEGTRHAVEFARRCRRAASTT